MVANPEMAAVAVMRSSFTSVRPVSESDAGDERGCQPTLVTDGPFIFIRTFSRDSHWLCAVAVKAGLCEYGCLLTVS